MIPKDDDYMATVTRLEAKIAELWQRLDDGDEQIADLKKRLSEKPFEDAVREKCAISGMTATETVREMNKGKTAAEVNADDTAVPLDKATVLADRIRNVKLDDIPLAPCPNEKCGREGIVMSRPSNLYPKISYSPNQLYVQYRCGCGMCGPWAEDESEARALWNGVAEKVSRQDFECMSGLTDWWRLEYLNAKKEKTATEAVMEEETKKRGQIAKNRALAERVRELIEKKRFGIYRPTTQRSNCRWDNIYTEAELMEKE